MGKTPFKIIDGTSSSDVIAIGYTDLDGDILSNVDQDIYAYAGDDIVQAGNANDRIWGGIGDDDLNGRRGDDRLYGEDGNDTLRGGRGEDTLEGGNGNDRMLGGLDADLIKAGRGNDTVFGGQGDDKIYGNKGNNFLDGQDGNDYISSGDQTSTLDGGADDDTLVLRMKKGGDHLAEGGSGADTFKFIQSGSSAVSDITLDDFELGIDNFTVEGVAGSTYLGLLGAAAVTDSGGDALVNMSSGDTILFNGITESELETFFGL